MKEVEADKPKEPSADDFAKLSSTLREGEMLIKQEFKFAGQVLEIPVLDIDFEGQEIISDELAKLVQETPKERRLKKELNPEIVKTALKNRRQKQSSRLMIRRALASFSPELQAGLELDLQTQTRAEVMRKLRPTGASKKKPRKDAKKSAKKEKNLTQVVGDRFRRTF